MERRPLTPAEFAKVLEAARKGPPWKGKARTPINGRDRAAIYLLASFTGYRRLELSSITPAAFQFGSDPTLTVVRGMSKRRRPECQPLNREIAEFFRQYVKGKPADKPLWNIGAERTALMIQADMLAAGLPYTKGKVVVDFHSLRQTFAADLARAGVSPKVTQQLVRHSDVNLTMKVYAKMGSDDERAAVESLPVPSTLTQHLTQDSGRRRKVSPRHEASKGRADNPAPRNRTSKKRDS
jgi:integrase